MPVVPAAVAVRVTLGLEFELVAVVVAETEVALLALETEVAVVPVWEPAVELWEVELEWEVE